MQRANKYLPLLGRALIGASFMLSGIGKLAAHDATVEYISSSGLPFAQLAWCIALPWSQLEEPCSWSATGPVRLPQSLPGLHWQRPSFFIATSAIRTRSFISSRTSC